MHDAPSSYRALVRLFLYLFLNDGIDYRYCRDVEDVAYGAFCLGKVDGLVQTHLDRTYDLGIVAQGMEHLCAAVGRAQVGEYECVDLFSF